MFLLPYNRPTARSMLQSMHDGPWPQRRSAQNGGAGLLFAGDDFSADVHYYGRHVHCVAQDLHLHHSRDEFPLCLDIFATNARSFRLDFTPTGNPMRYFLVYGANLRELLIDVAAGNTVQVCLDRGFSLQKCRIRLQPHAAFILSHRHTTYEFWWQHRVIDGVLRECRGAYNSGMQLTSHAAALAQPALRRYPTFRRAVNAVEPCVEYVGKQAGTQSVQQEGTQNEG